MSDAQEQQAAIENEAPRAFNCAQCGAKLSFSPGSETLKCSHCGHANEIAREDAPVEELDYGAHLTRLADEAETEQRTTITCESCGAEMDRPENLAAFGCAYCGSNIVASESSTRTIKPESLLPFHVTKEQAWKSFRQWIKSRWFAPNDLKKYARTDQKLEGVYVPHWTYDCNTVTEYTGQRGDDYWETVGSGKNKKRVCKTDWTFVSGTVREEFNDVLVLASRSLPRKYADRLGPWGLPELVPYKDDYLAGFRAETYQIDLAEGFGEAKGIMAEKIRSMVEFDIGGDHQRIHSLSTRHNDISFKHILLPVWISAYRYREKVYRILINARTGEVQGERPFSAWKIAFAVLLGIVAAGAAYMLTNL